MRGKNARQRKILKRGLLWAAGLLGMAAAIATGFVTYVLLGGTGKLPDQESLSSIAQPQASRLLDIKQREIGRVFQENRSNIRYEELPTHLVDMLVLTEDRRFYYHQGIDYLSLARVFFKSVLLQENSGGGSTLSQQLVKNLFARRSYAFFSLPLNKIRECIIARRLEKVYSKEKIIELYLNTVPFGYQVYGIEAASQYYFQSEVDELSLTEAATLVGMLKATTTYHPVLHPENARSRRNVVLALYCNRQEAGCLDSLQQLPLHTRVKQNQKRESVAQYYRWQVIRKASQLLDSIGRVSDTSYDLHTDGLVIYTTLDLDLQAIARKAANEHLKKIQRQWDREKHNKNRFYQVAGQEAARITGMAPVAARRKLQQDSIHTYLFEKGTVTTTRWDSLLHHLRVFQTGLVAMDPSSGEIRAYVGGADPYLFPYDVAGNEARHQVGSVFKPVVYAAALEAGISPCSYTTASRPSVADAEGEAWRPKNANNAYEGKYSMGGALESSVNTVTVKLLEQVGIESVISLARQMGVTSDLPEVPSVALGSASLSLWEVATLYSTLVKEGKRPAARLIREIHTKEGTVLYRAPQFSEHVLSEKTSRLLLHLLKGVVERGTGAALRSQYQIPAELAGKTGTSQHGADGWFVGVTPGLVVACWTGGAYPSIRFTSPTYGQGAYLALPVVGTLLEETSDQHLSTYLKGPFPKLTQAEKSTIACDSYRELWFLERWLDQLKNPEPREKRDGWLKRLFQSKK